METEGRNYRLRLGLPDITQPYLGKWLTPADAPFSLTDLGDSNFLFDQPTPGTWLTLDNNNVLASTCLSAAESLHENHPPEDTRPQTGDSASSDRSSGKDVKGNETFSKTDARGWELTVKDLRTDQTEYRAQRCEDGASLSHFGSNRFRTSPKLSELWLHAGRAAEERPRLLQWEVSHVLEEMLRKMLFPAYFDKIELGSMTWENGDFSSQFSDSGKQVTLPPRSLSDSIQETDLVRAALCALQGVPTAVSWLEQLAATFSSTAADRSSDNLRTLWLRSSSTSALSKVLADFAKAGRVACQLESFISYFLDEQINMDIASVSQKETGVKGSNRKKRKRQHFVTDRNSEAGFVTSSENWEGVEGPEISPHCLVNQAYAAAVRTLMQGNLASLNTVGASVRHRRQKAMAGHSLQMPEPEEEDAGFVFGFRCGDVTLLELYLHTHRLREQLQALAAVCRISEEASGKRQPTEGLEEICTRDEDGTRKGPMTLLSDLESLQISVARRGFEEFPRGAELLTYLYVKLLEADTLHLELLRFLFERACQPYTVFIHSWLYHASVQDPYHEFIVKPMPPTCLRNTFAITGEHAALSSLQVRKGVSVPCFLEEVCTPLLRAGQQLQILSKLLETRQFAPHFANFPLASMGSPLDPSINPSSLLSDVMDSESTLRGPILHFDKKALQGVTQQRERRSQIMKGRYDRLFAELANPCLPHDEVVHPEVGQEVVPSRRRLWKSVEERDLPKSMLLEKLSRAKVKSPRGSLALAVMRMENPHDISVGSQKEVESVATLLKAPATLLAPEKRGSFLGRFLKSRYQDNMFQLPEFQTQTSYISDFQRGTGWPMWGLPKNPFLSYIDDGNTPFHYTYTNFPENNHCWDVAVHWGDPIGLSDSQSRFLEESENGSIVDPRPGLQNRRVVGEEPDWFTNLEESFKRKLTCGLDEQILQANYESLGYEFERANGYWSPYTLGGQPWGYNTCVQSFSLASQRNGGRRLQTNPQRELVDSSIVEAFEKRYFVEECKLLREIQQSNVTSKGQSDKTSLLVGSSVADAFKEENLPLRAGSLQVEEYGKSTMSPKVDVQDSSVSSSGDKPEAIEETETQGSDENEESTSGACQTGRGANWETYLGSEHKRHLYKEVAFQTLACEDVEDNNEEIPLVVAVNQCLVQEILYQYKCASMFTVRLLQESLHLQDHCAALRCYYFMERGDWAEYFLTALCKHEWNSLGGQPRLLEVQGMLGTALQNSSCEGDEYAERLYILNNTLDGHPLSSLNTLTGFAQHSRFLGTFVSCNQLDAFDFIKMGYKVDWPLSLILTPSAVSLYSSIFTFLLRTKLTMYSLADIWRHLQVIGHSLDKGRRLADYQEQKKKFRTLQLFRQQIGHVVTTIQRYTESQLLHVVWSRFLNSIQNEVKDIHDLEKVHSVYLEDACHQCFLSSDMEDVKSCIDTIMQCTLDFRAALLAASRDNIGHSRSINDDLFDKVFEVQHVFEAHLHKLFAFHRRPEPQYGVLLTDFWMCLDFNGFLGRSPPCPTKAGPVT